MIKQLLDIVGEFGPEVLFLITLFLLRFKTNFAVYYIFGMIFGTIVNSMLKNIIKQPRPIENKKLFDEMLQYNKLHQYYYVIPHDQYGMPSGHSNSVIYSTFFVHLVFHNTKITLLYLLIATNTMIQRFNNFYHSVAQVFFGALFGALVGYFIFYMARNFNMGKLTLKKDDLGPMFN